MKKVLCATAAILYFASASAVFAAETGEAAGNTAAGLSAGASTAVGVGAVAALAGIALATSGSSDSSNTNTATATTR